MRVLLLCAGIFLAVLGLQYVIGEALSDALIKRPKLLDPAFVAGRDPASMAGLLYDLKAAILKSSSGLTVALGWVITALGFVLIGLSELVERLRRAPVLVAAQTSPTSPAPAAPPLIAPTSTPAPLASGLKAACPACGLHIEYTATESGRDADCPNCKATFTLP